METKTGHAKLWIICTALFLTVSVSSFAQDIPRPRSLTQVREYKGSVGTRLTITSGMVEENAHVLLGYQLVEPGRIPAFVFASGGSTAIFDFIPSEPRKTHVWIESAKKFGVGTFVFVILNHTGKPASYVVRQFSLYVGPESRIKTTAAKFYSQAADGQLIRYGSTAVGPSRGRGPFAISYQLNDTAHVTHRVVKGADDIVWSSELKNQPPGQRSWTWDRTKGDKSRATAGSDYSAQIEAEAPSDPKVRGIDGRPFEVTE